VALLLSAACTGAEPAPYAIATEATHGSGLRVWGEGRFPPSVGAGDMIANACAGEWVLREATPDQIARFLYFGRDDLPVSWPFGQGSCNYDLSQRETCVGCTVSWTTAAISLVRLSRSICSRILAEKSAIVCCASYLLR
jgi:hypothetical protein